MRRGVQIFGRNACTYNIYIVWILTLCGCTGSDERVGNAAMK